MRFSSVIFFSFFFCIANFLEKISSLKFHVFMFSYGVYFLHFSITEFTGEEVSKTFFKDFSINQSKPRMFYGT